MHTQNERVMRRFIDDVLNAEHPEALTELVHPEYVHRAPGEELRGHEGLATLLRGYRAAFPDLRVQIEELLSFDDATLLSFTLTGTHGGDLLGYPPTGRPVRVHGMVRSRFRDGKIAEEWEILDRLSLFEQLGLVGS